MLHAALIERAREFRAHLVGGAHRHGRFGDDDAVAVQVRADGARHRQHVAQVGRTVLPGGRADGDQLEKPVLHALRRIGREFDAAGLRVALDERVEPGLVDRDFAALQALDLARIDVHAHDVVAGVGQAGPRHQAHVAGAENRHSHYLSS